MESFERHPDTGGNASEMIEEGRRLMRQDEHGPAFVCFERALALLSTCSPEQQRDALIGEARVLLAGSLIRLGKLALALQATARILADRGKYARAIERFQEQPGIRGLQASRCFVQRPVWGAIFQTCLPANRGQPAVDRAAKCDNS